jgi:hypothetical protein
MLYVCERLRAYFNVVGRMSYRSCKLRRTCGHEILCSTVSQPQKPRHTIIDKGFGADACESQIGLARTVVICGGPETNHLGKRPRKLIRGSCLVIYFRSSRSLSHLLFSTYNLHSLHHHITTYQSSSWLSRTVSTSRPQLLTGALHAIAEQRTGREWHVTSGQADVF